MTHAFDDLPGRVAYAPVCMVSPSLGPGFDSRPGLGRVKLFYIVSGLGVSGTVVSDFLIKNALATYFGIRVTYVTCNIYYYALLSIENKYI